MHPSKLALGPSPTVAHFLRPSSIEGHPIYYGPKSNAFIRQAFQRDDQVEREKGWAMLGKGKGREGEGGEAREKKVRLWKGKKRRTRRRDADGWRATIESCFSATKATRRELPGALQPGRA